MSAAPRSGDARFPRTARILAKHEFDLVFRDGARRHSPSFRAHCLPCPGQPARLGLAVPKRAIARASARNRVRRLAREAFRFQRETLAGLAVVLVAKPEAARATAKALRDEIDALLARCGALKPADAAGTIARPN